MKGKNEGEVRAMRRLIRWAALLLAGLLIATGLYYGLRRDEGPAAGSTSAALGMMLLEKEGEVYVLAVTQGSPADRAGILPGDYLLQAGSQPLTEVLQLDALIDDGPSMLSVTLRRDGQDVQLELPAR